MRLDRPAVGPLYAVLALCLVACAAPQPREPAVGTALTPPALTAPPPPRASAEPAADAMLERFVAEQIAQAQQATRDMRLAEAALAWEALSLAMPQRAEFAASLEQTRRVIAQAVAQRMAVAAAARQRGDHTTSERAWLGALALDPAHAPAAAALRQLERERHQASVVGRFGAPPGAPLRASTVAAFASPGRAASTPSAVGGRALEAASVSVGQRNLLEHASLLASQGDMDAAISLLAEQLARTPNDSPCRLALAALHVQRADLRFGAHPKAAVEDLQRALRLNPRLESVRLRLRQLQRASQ